MKLLQAKTSILAASICLALAGCGADGTDGTSATNGTDGTNGTNGKDAFFPSLVYTGYPITLSPDAENSTSGTTTKTTSVSYGGQMARHILREQLKATLASPAVTDPNDKSAILAKVNEYLKNESGVVDDTTIIAPVSNSEFTILQTKVSELSSGKSLYGTLYDTSSGKADPISGVDTADANTVMGVPGDKTAKEVTDLWADNFARMYSDSSQRTKVKYLVDKVNGLEYNQLMAKYMMGAAFYNQAADKYLDEYLEKDAKPHNKPYKDGAYYSGLEHSWDEAFGYFGAAANYGLLLSGQNYNIKKLKEGNGYADAADWDGDGKVSLYTEYTSGPAYYAADADKNANGESAYGKNIMNAFLHGRHLIANAVDDKGHSRVLTSVERATLKSYATTIQRNWEKVIAEAVYKYAGKSYNDIEAYQTTDRTDQRLETYIHHWSEGKGMMLALQYGGSGSKITKADFQSIDNELGFGPVLADGSQVTGVSGMTFSKSAAAGTAGSAAADAALDAYQVKLKAVQTKLDELYNLKAKSTMIP